MEGQRWPLPEPTGHRDMIGEHHDGRRVRRPDGGGLRPPRPAGAGNGAVVNASDIALLTLAVALVGYLLAALLFPDRF